LLVLSVHFCFDEVGPVNNWGGNVLVSCVLQYGIHSFNFSFLELFSELEAGGRGEGMFLAKKTIFKKAVP
jgi:hypothetical protein